MAFKFEFPNNTLKVTDTSNSNAVLLHMPKARVWYDNDFLNRDEVKLIIDNHFELAQERLQIFSLSDCIDELDAAFADADAFRTWMQTNVAP